MPSPPRKDELLWRLWQNAQPQPGRVLKGDTSVNEWCVWGPPKLLLLSLTLLPAASWALGVRGHWREVVGDERKP